MPEQNRQLAEDHYYAALDYQRKGMIPEAEAEGAKARVLGWKQQLKKAP